MRSSVFEEGGKLRIRIPMQRSILLCLFLLVWLTFWSYGGWDTIHKLLRQFDLFTLFWLGGWAAGELFVIFWLLRTASGFDLVTVTSECVAVRKSVLGIGPTRNYSPSDIRNLRFQPYLQRSRGSRPSGVAFDYGAKTVSFGDGIDEAEANQLISLIKSRCRIPETVSPTGTGISLWQHDRGEC